MRLRAPRPGRRPRAPAARTSFGSSRFRSPIALAWRLQRGALLGWTIGFALLGAVSGAATDGIEELLTENPELAGLFARLGGAEALTDSYLAAMMAFFGLIASA